jgi:hypothetical protein
MNMGAHSADLFMMENIMTFYLHYFNFWPNLVCTLLAQACIVIGNALVYLMPVTGNMLVMCLGGILWSSFNFFFTHIIIYHIGMKFIEVEILNIGNEELLNSLKEGVIILDEGTGLVRFLNKAAKVFKVELEKSFTMQMSHNDDPEIDQSSKQFALFDKAIFETSTESVYTLRSIHELDHYISLDQIINDQVLNNATSKRLIYKIAQKYPKQHEEDCSKLNI